MPPNHGVRLNEDEGGAPIPPQPGDPDPEDAITLAEAEAEAGACGRAADDGQLLAKSQILGYQRGPGFKEAQVGVDSRTASICKAPNP